MKEEEWKESTVHSMRGTSAETLTSDALPVVNRAKDFHWNSSFNHQQTPESLSEACEGTSLPFTSALDVTTQ